MSSSANNTAATATQTLFASVAAAAVSPSASDAQRAAAMQYLASLIDIGVPTICVWSLPLRRPQRRRPSALQPPRLPPPPSFAAATTAPASTAGTIAPWTAGILYGVVPDLHLHDFTVQDDGRPWYSIVRGRSVGITQDHSLASRAVLGVSNNGWRSHKTLAGALNEFNHALDLNLVEVRPF
ncbi:hypothetical protein C8F04DRAFT_1274945 [Mycena alexandri]|uniref:Uncharacterized protein n=1 Tax=Mycena alexandri TaxID=1745969 RepID=A0AAD6S3I1_9AGAR|nr:hypothetical protein C8F04DRAFT_1274945 [Mycena alexandri]